MSDQKRRRRGAQKSPHGAPSQKGSNSSPQSSAAKRPNGGNVGGGGGGNNKPPKCLLPASCPTWFELGASLAGRDDVLSESDRSKVPPDMVREFRKLADETIRKDGDSYERWFRESASSEDVWNEKVS